MAFGEILDVTHVPTLRDWAQLGGRVFVADGVNPNLCLDGDATHDRIMGCFPQQSLAVALGGGTALRGNTAYLYGVRRVVRLGAIEVPSAVVFDSVTTEWHALECGAAGEDEAAGWTGITDGAFKATIGGVEYAVADCNFSGCTTMDEVAAVVREKLRLATGQTETVTWDAETAAFVFRGYAQWGYLAAPGAGTDISGAAWLAGTEASGATVATADANGLVPLAEYEFLPTAEPAPERAWTVAYQVLRSQAESLASLYLVAELSEEEWAELEDGVFEDDVADADLPAVAEIETAEDETNLFLAPVRYLRAWKGRLLAGGSFAYSEGTVTVEEGDLSVAAVASPGAVRATDVGATIEIEGAGLRLVSGADVAAGEWTLSAPADGAVAAVGYRLWRDMDTVWVLNVQPGNIEGWTLGAELVSNAGANDRVQGLAVNGGVAYVLRRHSVELVEGDGAELALVPHPASPPGCVSHATIADMFAPTCLYYAGGAGVWALTPGGAELVSGAIQGVLDEDVDHALDHRSHAVYDPNTGLYYLWVFGRAWREYGVQVPQLCLVYDTRLRAWYGPWELAASESELWRDADGRLVPVIGVAGGVARLGWGACDGADDSGVVAAGDSATADTLSVAAAEFPTADGGLAGCPVHVRRPSSGAVQRRLIKVNGAVTLTIHGEWEWVPAVGDEYQVGSIRWAAETGELQAADVFDATGVVGKVRVAYARDTVANVMTVRLAGGGNRGTRIIERAVDMGSDSIEVAEVDGARAGLRARSVSVRLSGDGVRPVEIRGVRVLSTKTGE